MRSVSTWQPNRRAASNSLISADVSILIADGHSPRFKVVDIDCCRGRSQELSCERTDSWCPGYRRRLPTVSRRISNGVGGPAAIEIHPSEGLKAWEAKRCA